MLRNIFKTDKMIWFGFLYAIGITCIVLYLERDKIDTTMYIDRYNHKSIFDVIKHNFLYGLNASEGTNKTNKTNDVKEGMENKITDKFSLINNLNELKPNDSYNMYMTFKFYTPQNHIQESIDVMNHIIHNVNSNQNTQLGISRPINQIPTVFNEDKELDTKVEKDECDKKCFFENVGEWGNVQSTHRENAHIEIQFRRDLRFPDEKVFAMQYKIVPSKKHFGKEHDVDEDIYRELFMEMSKKVLLPGKTTMQLTGTFNKFYKELSYDKVHYFILEKNELTLMTPKDNLKGKWNEMPREKLKHPYFKYFSLSKNKALNNMTDKVLSKGYVNNDIMVFYGGNKTKNYNVYLDAKMVTAE